MVAMVNTRLHENATAGA